MYEKKRKMKNLGLLGLELKKAREGAKVTVVAVQPFHDNETPLVQDVPLQSLVLQGDFLLNKSKKTTWTEGVESE